MLTSTILIRETEAGKNRRIVESGRMELDIKGEEGLKKQNLIDENPKCTS